MINFKSDVKSTILNFLYSSDNFENAVNETIKFIGEEFNVSRVYIFENTDDDSAMCNTFEWCNKGISPQIDNLQNVTYVEDLGDSYEENFDENGMFYCPDVHTLPKEQFDILEVQGIKAILQCSIMENGKFKGMVGFDDCNECNRNWHDEPEKIEVLVFLAHTLSIYLLKERHLKKLSKEQFELQKLVQKAQSAKEAKSRFLSAVSHDMRTPLNGILGLVDILDDKINDDANIKMFNNKKDYFDFVEVLNENLMELKNSGKFLLNLINDTLDVSKMENGNFSLSPEIVVGENEIMRFGRMIRNIAESKNIILNLIYDDVVKGYFNVDSVRISQIFFNIIGNSIKFSKRGSNIDITIDTLKKVDNFVYKRFVIRDYGIGMDKEFLKKIFIPFEQEVQDGKSNRHGTGLGMTITKQIIDSMNGTISIESEKGKGTTTTVILPLQLANDEEIASLEVDNSLLDTLDFKGMRVLLCEDNKVNAKVATNYLKKKDLLIEIAENGKIGLDMFNASKEGYYDFVLMDIQMPIMNGIETTKAIRKSNHSQAQTIPIIALSANIMDQEKKAAIKADMNAYIPKPIEITQLFTVISKTLSL